MDRRQTARIVARVLAMLSVLLVAGLEIGGAVAVAGAADLVMYNPPRLDRRRP